MDKWKRLVAGIPAPDAVLLPFPPSLRDVAEDVDASPFEIALNNVVDVGAGFERLTSNDEETSEPVRIGPVRAMRIRNDCMLPMLAAGDIVFVTPAETVKDGDIVIAAVDILSRMCKRIRIPADGPSYLEPINGEGIIEEPRFTVLGVVAYQLKALSGR